MRLLVIASVLSAAVVPALAQDDVQDKPLTGSYYMSPAIDAEDPKAPADHINLSITGDAAKAMWDAMKVKTEPDECIGRMAKWVQSLVCYGPPTPDSGTLAPGETPFECFIGINLKNASVELSQDC